MAATRSKKKTTIQRNGGESKNQSSPSLDSPSPKKKMTAEERAAARARARVSMCGDVESKDSSTKAKSKNSSKNAKGATKISEDTLSSTKSETTPTQTTASYDAPAEKVQSDDKKEFKVSDQKKKIEKEVDTDTIPKSTPVLKLKTASVVGPHLNGVAKLLMVDMQAEDAKEVDTAIRNLMHMFSAKDKPLHQRKVVREANLLGAATVLVLVMRRWSNDDTIQHNACQCLWVYANASSTGKIALIKCGAIEAIADALQQSPSRPFCAAIADLSEPPSTSTSGFGDARLSWEELHQAWDPFVSEYNGIALIAEAMESLEDLPHAIADCASLFNNLLDIFKHTATSCNQVKSQIRKTGAYNLIFNADQKHPQHERLREHRTSFLKQFL